MINCAVTVMPMFKGRVGFIRRDTDDTYGGQLVAPGGKVEESDGILIDSVPYYSAEMAAIRELKEEVGVSLGKDQLQYFCSLTLPNGRVVISFYCELSYSQLETAIGKLTPLTRDEIMQIDEFAPGMKEEALLLLQQLRRVG